MAYNIYKGDKLNAVCQHSMDAVSQAVQYYRHTTKPVTVTQVALDGTETPYDWERAYKELCNQ
jgi:hypothetical protein